MSVSGRASLCTTANERPHLDMFRLFRRLAYRKSWKDAIFALGRRAIMARRILVIPPSGNQERKTCPR